MRTYRAASSDIGAFFGRSSSGFLRTLRRSGLAALAAMSVFPVARAQYPEKPVRVVVPFAAGAGADIATRFMAGRLAEMWAKAIVVDNQVGANSIIGAQGVARAAADGHTLLAPNDTTLAANPALYAKLPYDPIKDFAPVALFGETPFVLVTSPNFPVRSVKELIDAAKAKPGEINFGTSGVASAHHLPMEMLMHGASIKMLHVPYKSASDAVTGVLGGQVQVMFAGVSAVLPFLQAGKLIPLAVGTSERLAVLPNVPTMAESGFPGFRYGAWLGLVAPSGTPVAIVNKINADVRSILGQSDAREKLSSMGFLPAAPATPDVFRKHVQDEMTRYGKLIRAAGIEPSR